MRFFKNFELTGDRLRPFHLAVSEIIKENVAVLVYVGDADYVTNWMGNEAWTKELEWEGKSRFRRDSAKKELKSSTKTTVGDVRNSKLLTFVRLNNAGKFTYYRLN